MELTRRQACLRTVQYKNQEEKRYEPNLAKPIHASKLAHQQDKSQVEQRFKRLKG
jgi:hypothetical protein